MSRQVVRVVEEIIHVVVTAGSQGPAGIAIGTLPMEFSDDAAAAAGGIVVGETYRTGSILKVRVV